MFDVLCLVTAVLLADMHACVGHCKNGTYTFCLIKHSIIKGKSSRFNQKFIQHKYWKKRSLLFVFLLPNARYFICMWQEQKHVSGYKVTSLCVCVSVCVCVCMRCVKGKMKRDGQCDCYKFSCMILQINYISSKGLRGGGGRFSCIRRTYCASLPSIMMMQATVVNIPQRKTLPLIITGQG